MDLREEHAIGGDPARHWYYISKGRAIKALLGPGKAKSLLDVGAGSGVFSKMLVSEGRALSAVCVDPNYDDGWLARSAPRVSYVRSIDATDAEIVLMIDVIEHVDDDDLLIREYADKCAPGTQFLICVPAFDLLWSSHDDFLDHRRRYTLKSLRETVTAGGLAPLKLRYFFGALFPAVALARMTERRSGPPEASRLKTLPGWLNAALVKIHDVERAALLPWNTIAGVSAFCLAEKR